MNRMRSGLTGALVAILLATGCGMTGERIGSAPLLTNPSEAATVTLYRDGSLVGWFATIRVELDGQEIYRIARNEAFTFQLDPGQYLLAYRIGFNECRQIIWARPRESHRIRLSPTCS
jgi:hypothetical protein